MLETEVTLNKFLLKYVEGLLQAIPDERMTEQPAYGVNHPAWILCHLIYTADSAAALLGGQKTLDPSWTERFGPNSTPSTVRADFLPKAELIELLHSRFAAVHALSVDVDPQRLAAPNPRAQMRDRLPTVGDLVAFIMTAHMGIHLGQLSTWRRLIGLERLF